MACELHEFMQAAYSENTLAHNLATQEITDININPLMFKLPVLFPYMCTDFIFRD